MVRRIARAVGSVVTLAVFFVVSAAGQQPAADAPKEPVITPSPVTVVPPQPAETQLWPPRGRIVLTYSTPPPSTPTPASPQSSSVEQLLDELTAVKAQKAELERKEKAITDALRERLRVQRDRLNQLGLEPVPPVDAARPAGASSAVGNSVTLAASVIHPSKTEPKPLYHPVKVGATWVLQTGEGSSATFRRFTVTGSEKIADGSYSAAVGEEWPGNGIVTFRQTEVSERGTYTVSWHSRKLDQPLCQVKLPAKAGDTWELPPAGLQDGRPNRVYRVAGEEEIEVPAGKFKALRVRSEWDDYYGKKVREELWYAPAVGLIKHVTKSGDRQEVVQVMKSFVEGNP
jgi:hypothetical protein